MIIANLIFITGGDMSFLSKLQEIAAGAMDELASNAGRAANNAERKGYPDQSKIDNARDVADQARYERDRLREMAKEGEERDNK